MISLSGPEANPLPVAGMGAFNTVRFNAAQFNQAGSDSRVNSSFYLFDSQTSTRYLLNRDADVSDSDLYRAYGEPMVDTGTTRNHHGFQGQVGSMADSPDRVWMRARVYDTLTGTWLSRDPIGFAGGDWNLYRFAANNPANMIDPSGLSCECCESYFAWFWCCDQSCWETPPIFTKYPAPGSRAPQYTDRFLNPITPVDQLLVCWVHWAQASSEIFPFRGLGISLDTNDMIASRMSGTADISLSMDNPYLIDVQLGFSLNLPMVQGGISIGPTGGSFGASVPFKIGKTPLRMGADVPLAPGVKPGAPTAKAPFPLKALPIYVIVDPTKLWQYPSNYKFSIPKWPDFSSIIGDKIPTNREMELWYNAR